MIDPGALQIGCKFVDRTRLAGTGDEDATGGGGDTGEKKNEFLHGFEAPLGVGLLNRL